MNLWINSRATHWTGDGDLHSVYFVMFGDLRISRETRKRDKAVSTLEQFARILGIDP